MKIGLIQKSDQYRAGIIKNSQWLGNGVGVVSRSFESLFPVLKSYLSIRYELLAISSQLLEIEGVFFMFFPKYCI